MFKIYYQVGFISFETNSIFVCSGFIQCDLFGCLFFTFSNVAEEQQQQQQPQDDHIADTKNGSTSQSTEASLTSSTWCVPTLLPPTPTDPVPGNWKTVEGVFVSVTSLMAPLMGDGFVGHPNITLGSGEFTILYVFDDTTRSEMLSMLMDGSSGNWINHFKMHIVKAKAYRIEPLSPPGMMTLDGEIIEYGVTQAQVNRHVARVFTRKRIINT